MQTYLVCCSIPVQQLKMEILKNAFEQQTPSIHEMLYYKKYVVFNLEKETGRNSAMALQCNKSKTFGVLLKYILFVLILESLFFTMKAHRRMKAHTEGVEHLKITISQDLRPGRSWQSTSSKMKRTSTSAQFVVPKIDWGQMCWITSKVCIFQAVSFTIVRSVASSSHPRIHETSMCPEIIRIGPESL